jgi:hypothetical protein
MAFVHLSAAASTFGVRLDKDFYFQQKNEKEIEVSVENSSGKLIFASIELYFGKENKATGEIEFDLSRKITNYDVVPASVAIPVGQSKKIKLIRESSEASDSEPEEYYRIRVIPKSADVALKNNPTLLSLLSEAEKREIEDDKGVSGSINVFIGSGSVLVVQQQKTQDNQISAKMKKLGGGLALTLANNSKYTCWLKNARIRTKNKTVNIGDFVIRGEKSKNHEITKEEIKSFSINEEEVDALIFSTPDKKEHTIKISNQSL